MTMGPIDLTSLELSTSLRIQENWLLTSKTILEEMNCLYLWGLLQPQLRLNPHSRHPQVPALRINWRRELAHLCFHLSLQSLHLKINLTRKLCAKDTLKVDGELRQLSRKQLKILLLVLKLLNLMRISVLTLVSTRECSLLLLLISS